jgi:hypothetical protein
MWQAGDEIEKSNRGRSRKPAAIHKISRSYSNIHVLCRNVLVVKIQEHPEMQ